MDPSEQSQITVFTAMDGRMADNKDNVSHVWTVGEVEALLKLYRERETEFKDPTTKKKTIWYEICQEMNRQGFSLNPLQCECKLKNMKATYRKSLEKAETRGIDPASRCPFYEELYEIFGLAPPLRTYPETIKPKKAVARKRTSEELESPATQVNIPQMQHLENGLSEALMSEGIANKRQPTMIEVLEEPSQHGFEKKDNSELVEALLVLRRSLERERQIRRRREKSMTRKEGKTKKKEKEGQKNSMKREWPC